MKQVFSRLKRRLLQQPINRLMLISFLLVSIVPVTLLSYRIYEAAWQDAWREIREKHQLLAQNLAAPITTYVNDHRAALGLLASTIDNLAADDHQRIKAAMTETLLRFPGFRTLTLVDGKGRIIATTNADYRRKRITLAREQCFLRSRNEAVWALSGIKKSPFNGKPTLIMSQPVGLLGNGKAKRVLMAELRIDFIERLRASIKFGRRGHSAIVDQKGRVIAHPNPDWMKQMRDLSHLSVVQKMMAGRTGVTEFYSPFVKKQMVAGYTSVPGIGWGIMVPQPREEVEEHVYSLLFAQIGWALVGLLLAGIVALILARWITRPINRLAASARELQKNGFVGEVETDDSGAPREIGQLAESLTSVVKGLQAMRTMHDELNQSLQERVDEATEELREANRRLDRLARIDHLTSLSNRRHLEASLTTSLNRRSTDQEPLCLIQIDIDHFKQVNDKYGHAAGDAILLKVADILRRTTRHGDLVARYGGDEFVIVMHLEHEIARQRARIILNEIENAEFRWHGEPIRITASIGLFFHDQSADLSCDEILLQVDKAMYQAKQEGRNRLVERRLAS